MRDSDWSRPNFLRSDWLLPILTPITTVFQHDFVGKNIIDLNNIYIYR